jgi:translocation and assembly module TamB
MNTAMAPGHDPALPPAPRRRWWRALVVLVGLVIAGIAGGVWFLGTQAALDALLERAVARSNGRLAVSGATGSLLSTVHIDRLQWRGDELTFDATGVALTWSPTDLFSRRFNAQGFAAQRLVIALKSSTGTSALPADLALPLEVRIARAGIGRIEWTSGDKQGVVSGLVFGYTGGATQHQLRNLEFVTAAGTLSGSLTLGATKPFPLTGTLAFAGDGDYRDASARADLNGSLETLGVDAKVVVRGARGDATAKLSPFAAVAVTAATVNVDGVDLARWAPTLPKTSLSVALNAVPSGERFAGTVDVRNADPGSIDADRIPLTTLHSRFAWTQDALELSAATATMPGRGRITGRAAIALDGKPATFALDVVDIDLRQIHQALGVTALRGTLAADVSGAVQNVRGELSQSDMSFVFAASVQKRQLEIARFRATAGTSEVAGRGRIALDGARAFGVDGSTRRFDPSRFGAFPGGSLDATFKASGALHPTWTAMGELTVAAGSKLSGVAVAGTARGEFAPRAIRNATADLRIASGSLSASGSMGAAGDQLKFSLQAPDLAAWRPLVPPLFATRLPAVVSGALRASGTVQLEPQARGAEPQGRGGEPQLRGLDVDAHGSHLVWGSTFAATSIDAKGTLSLPEVATGRVAMGERPVVVAIAATGLKTPQAAFTMARVDVSGSMTRHTATFELQGDGVDVHASATGGLQNIATNGTGRALRWTGTLDRLDNRGDYAVALSAPANLVLAGGYVRLTNASVAIAEGHADIAEFALDDGRITSRGAFNAIPLGALVRMAGQKMPLRSTLTLKGDWSVAASPRLNGAIHVARDQGDLYAVNTATIDRVSLGFGITALDAVAQFSDDATKANVQYRSARAGSGNLALVVGNNARDTPGHIGRDAPLTLSLQADVPSLQPLQPWLGTTAVIDGRARVDVNGHGTLDNIELGGGVTGDDIRIDLPRYGVLLNSGRVRMRLEGGKLLLDEFSIAAGEGTFTAQGTLAATAASGATAKITWQAAQFRVINRPDLRLIAGGNGTLALADGKIDLLGHVKFDEGRIEYTPTTGGVLADDVVIIGRPRSPPTSALGDLPLKLDVDVELGARFTFSGEGLDTGLRGQVRISTLPNGALNGVGTIQAYNGTYFALGQKLTIDRGQLIFDGPLENPALDVVALRKNLAVEAGVELTGTARFPRVRLVSNPPVPDNEKLAWLITGQGLNRASGGDMVALSAASAALLGRGQRPLTQDIANRVGLDDISFAESSVATATGTTRGQVITFGKRLSDHLTLVYEQGLTVATNALRIEYALTKTLTLRAEAGVVGSFGIYYRRSFD